MPLSEVQSYCSSRGIALEVQKVETNSSSFDGLVSEQSLPAKMDVAAINKTKGLSVSVYEYKASSIPGLPISQDDSCDEDDVNCETGNGSESDQNVNNGSGGQGGNGSENNQDNGNTGSTDPIDDIVNP